MDFREKQAMGLRGGGRDELRWWCSDSWKEGEGGRDIHDGPLFLLLAIVATAACLCELLPGMRELDLQALFSKRVYVSFCLFHGSVATLVRGTSVISSKDGAFFVVVVFVFCVFLKECGIPD